MTNKPKVQRYLWTHEGMWKTTGSPPGSFVDALDYEALERECEGLREEITRLRITLIHPSRIHGNYTISKATETEGR